MKRMMDTVQQIVFSFNCSVTRLRALQAVRSRGCVPYRLFGHEVACLTGCSVTRLRALQAVRSRGCVPYRLFGHEVACLTGCSVTRLRALQAVRSRGCVPYRLFGHEVACLTGCSVTRLRALQAELELDEDAQAGTNTITNLQSRCETRWSSRANALYRPTFTPNYSQL